MERYTTDIKEYYEKDAVDISHDDNGKWCIEASNEGGCSGTCVDLVDVIDWVKVNKPELLK